MKKFIYFILAGIILSNCAFAYDCKVIHKSAKYFENKIEKENGHNDACLYYNLAAAHWRRGNIQGTLDAYDVMTYIDPQDEEIYVRRAIIYSMYNNSKRADEEYARLVKNIPDSKIGNEHLSYVYLWLYDYENALKYINKTIKIDNGKDLKLIVQRADIYKNKGEYGKAIKDYTKYIESSLNNETKDYWWLAMAYQYRAECYEAIGKTQEAEIDMQKYEEYRAKEPVKKEHVLKTIKRKYNDFKRHKYAERLW